LDKFGSPRGNPAQRNKHAYGFRTGDIVRADIPRELPSPEGDGFSGDA